MEKRCTLGVVLAGGASSRFGTDKSAALLGGKPLLEWAIERAKPQVAALIVSTNNDIETPSRVECVADDKPGEGPLAGILAALGRAKMRGFTHLASFACDTPFFPLDTVKRLSSALYETHGGYAAARCRETAHPIFALWPVLHLQELKTAFAANARSMRSMENWLKPTWVDFPPEDGPEGDPFFNINTVADLGAAERWLSGQHGQLRN